MGNSIMIEGRDGIVIVDTTESLKAAKYEKERTKKRKKKRESEQERLEAVRAERASHNPDHGHGEMNCRQV